MEPLSEATQIDNELTFLYALRREVLRNDFDAMDIWSGVVTLFLYALRREVLRNSRSPIC